MTADKAKKFKRYLEKHYTDADWNDFFAAAKSYVEKKKSKTPSAPTTDVDIESDVESLDLESDDSGADEA